MLRRLSRKLAPVLSQAGAVLLLGLGACSDGVQLEVRRSTETNNLGLGESEIPLPAGELYVVSTIRITNNLGDRIGLGGPLFAVRTTDGVEHTGTALGDLLPDGCKIEESLAPGSTTECAVVFTIPEGANTEAVVYSDPEGGRHEAPMATENCTVCGGSCVDTSSDPHNCGACGRDAGSTGTCKNGKIVCNDGAEKCGDQCVDTSSDPSNCGACGSVVPSTYACVDGAPGCTEGNDCGSGCASTSDPDNCGSCGRVCPAPYTEQFMYQQSHPCVGYFCGCDAGYCETWLSSHERVSCDSVCGAYGLACEYAVWRYSTGGGLTDTGTCAQIPPQSLEQTPFYAVQCQCTG